ncbi:MAG: AAA family ATPase, partial [Lachnospiraceae bacterium]|nr:AAA family ATPase [Lachnospiraceae bacterium]
MTREGYIEKIIYKNEENGYAVFSVEGTDGEEIFVGNIFGVGEGLYIIAEGDYVNHPQYDIQFKFTSCEIKMPEDIIGIERYLGSGIIKGIGQVLAKKIVKKFKSETLTIIENEPERLAEISGISERKARAIATSYAEKKEFQEVVIFLSQYGISINMAMKIYGEYGDRVYEIIKGNPYKIAEDVSGIGFKIADEIARKMGINPDSEYRLRSVLIYVLTMAVGEGHMYLPKDILIKKSIELIRSTSDNEYGQSYGYAEYESADSVSSVYEQYMEKLEEQLMELSIESKCIIKEYEGEVIVYSAVNYFTELNIAKQLTDLQLRYEMPENELEAAIGAIEKDEDFVLDEQQRNAVRAAITAGVAVVTGGPGTGKTTIIDTIIKYFTTQGMEVKLCAPTGRAAKRMTEQTGWPAQTIHRLLEFSGVPSDERGNQVLKFGRNAENPLECDAVIVDEMSMVDCFIFNSLLQAVVYGTRLVLVGDINQLPSVGPGNVLKDIIASDCFPVSVLTKIYRQEDGSDIIMNAHKINRGEHLEIMNKSKDFFFIPRYNSSGIISEVKELILNNLPNYLSINPLDIQVLTPMRKYDVGVENLNRSLQGLLNPYSSEKSEKEKNEIIFREGDKVMQIKNNYRREWKIYSDTEKAKNGQGYV